MGSPVMHFMRLKLSHHQTAVDVDVDVDITITVIAEVIFIACDVQ